MALLWVRDGFQIFWKKLTRIFFQGLFVSFTRLSTCSHGLSSSITTVLSGKCQSCVRKRSFNAQRQLSRPTPISAKTCMRARTACDTLCAIMIMINTTMSLKLLKNVGFKEKHVIASYNPSYSASSCDANFLYPFFPHLNILKQTIKK